MAPPKGSIPHNFINLVGQRFMRLTVVEYLGSRGENKVSYWRCECACGNEVITKTSDLKSGNTNSCGCYKLDKIKATQTKHGSSSSGLYKRWTGILARCYDSNCKTYEGYGRRGIQVYEGWRHDYSAFQEYVLSIEPEAHKLLKKGYQIDRIDGTKNYEPGNIRLVTRTTNARNKSTCHKIHFKGEIHSFESWCHERHIGRSKHRVYLSRKDYYRAFNLDPAYYTIEVHKDRNYIVTEKSFLAQLAFHIESTV